MINCWSCLCYDPLSYCPACSLLAVVLGLLAGPVVVALPERLSEPRSLALVGIAVPAVSLVVGFNAVWVLIALVEAQCASCHGPAIPLPLPSTRSTLQFAAIPTIAKRSIASVSTVGRWNSWAMGWSQLPTSMNAMPSTDIEASSASARRMVLIRRG